MTRSALRLLPMDVWILILSFQWPLESWDEDTGEIRRRRIVCLNFNKELASAYKDRFKLYISKSQVLSVLTPAVLEFGLYCLTDQVASQEGCLSQPELNDLSEALKDFAMKWRYNRATNFSVEFPLAKLKLRSFFLHLCRSASSLLDWDDDIAMWLVFLFNIHTILEYRSLESDAAAGEYIMETISSAMYNECDHVHNGFRRRGATDSCRLNRKGYYYGAMQLGYANFYSQRPVTPHSSLFTTLADRYEPIWMHHDINPHDS